MRDEYHALIKNKTWILVPRLPDTNIVCCMWLIRHKYLEDGTLSHYKARLVANASTQLEGIDVEETFSPVLKPGTIQTVFSLAASRHWPIHQLDVKNAFLHGDLSETIYMHQPPGFRDLVHPDYVYLLQREGHMVNCNPSRTPVDTESKLGNDGDPFSRLQLFSSSATDLVAYSDADWAGCLTTRRSTSEAEYHGVANAVVETCWLRNLLRELHTPLSTDTLVYCDNVSAVYLSCNPVQHQRTKHIEIDIHYARDLVVAGQVRVLHVPSRYQFANIFTKGLLSALFEEIRSSLSVRASADASGGGVCGGNLHGMYVGVSAIVLATLLKPQNWIPPADRRFFLDAYEVGKLCYATEQIFISETTGLQLKAPIKVFGDLHGQFTELMRLFDEYGFPSSAGELT
nr:ribonuclease H-like domain-containing protein [Tanacetum cinerariifolium]